jgi:hypothetical protein
LTLELLRIQQEKEYGEKKPQLMVVEGLKSRRFDGLLNNFFFFLLVKGIFS